MKILAIIMLIALLFSTYFSYVRIHKHFFRNEKKSFFQIYIVDMLTTAILIVVIIRQAIEYLKV